MSLIDRGFYAQPKSVYIMDIENHRWPPFLDLLDSDPTQAMVGFSAYAMKFFEVCPPREFRSVRESDREDLRQNVILYCIEDDFRVLKKYKDIGRPFGGWFYFIARNKILDHLRGTKNDELPIDGPTEEPGPGYEGIEGPATTSPVGTTEARTKLAAVRECIAMLDEYCQLLLKMASEEFRPREMVRVLRWPREKATKASNDLAYCRTKLKNLIVEKGLSELLGDHLKEKPKRADGG